MMILSLSFEPPFNEITKKLSEKVKFETPLTLDDLLIYLKNIYGDAFYDLLWKNGEKGNFSSFLSIIINGISYRHENFLNTKLKDGDDITFLYLYFGG
jgi:molybdopterin converting factor small subunit